jgi:hypothetical protein
MKKLMAVGLVVLVTGVVAAAGLGPPHVGFWVDDELYRTIGTPTMLPDQGPNDGIFVFIGLSGQTPVGEAKPGDQDYNGGRWQPVALQFTEEGIAVHDPDDDGEVNFELTSWEEVVHHIGLGHLEVVGYGDPFVCPVIEIH